MLVLLFAMLLQSAAISDLREGLMAMGRGDLPAARERLEAASKQDSGNAVVWAALAQVYFKTHNKHAALEAAKKAEMLDPDNPAIQHALAMFYSGQGEPGRAARFERQYARSTQADAEALSRVVQLALQAGETATAIEAAQADLAQRDLPAQHHLLGQAYEAGNQLTSAIQEYRAAARLAPSKQEFSFSLAQALLRSERFAEATVYLEAVSKQFVSDPQFRLALGVAYYGLRRFPEAVKAFLGTIELAPDTEQPYLFLGKMLDQAGASLSTIQEKFEQFRKRNPENYLGSFLVAKALMLTGGAAETIEAMLRESISKNAGLWEAHADLGDVLSRRGKHAEAATEFESAAKLNAAEPSIPFRLARVYDRLKQPENALAQRARHKQLLAMPKTGMGTDKL